jgi:hypothetical protein
MTDAPTKRHAPRRRRRTAITVTPGPNYPGIPKRWFDGLYDRLREATSTASTLS